ncbi:ABC transporter substrate-binding protein [Mesorhizobium sp. LSHC414A00]|nr:ABC transporter substrate-binding protein [Mesorhizobium sp. LSHC414A00]
MNAQTKKGKTMNISLKSRPYPNGLRVAAIAASLIAPVAAPTFAWGQDRPLVIARNLDLNSLDPSRAGCDTCMIYLTATYETLVHLGKDGRSVEPGLAESWEANEDNSAFVFKLNPKAVFADGTPVEAKDVIWSWNRLINGQGGNAWTLGTIKSMEAPDSHTVKVQLTQPDGEFLGKVMVSSSAIINSDLAEAHGARAGKDAGTDPAEPWFLSNSAGSGPFVLAAYSPNAELRLKRNDKYWGQPAGVSEVLFKQVKDSVAQAQLIQNGDVDIAMQIDPDTAKTISSPDIVVDSLPSANYIYMALSPGAKANPVPMTKEIRQAIGYAVDYKGLVEFTVGGAGRLQPSPVPNEWPGTQGLPEPEYNVEKAKELLEKAGLKDGLDLEAKFPNMNYYGVDMSTLMQKLQQDLSKANIRIKLEPLTFPVWLDTVRGDGTPLTASFYAPDYYGTGQYIDNFGMIPGTRWAKRSGAERLGLLNAKEKELLDKALAAPEDKRDGFFKQAALEMTGDRIIIGLVNPDNIYVYNKHVQGVRYSLNDLMPLRELSFKQ